MTDALTAWKNEDGLMVSFHKIRLDDTRTDERELTALCQAVANATRAATVAEYEAKLAALAGVTSIERNEVVADLCAILEAQGKALHNTHHLAPVTVSRQKFVITSLTNIG